MKYLKLFNESNLSSKTYEEISHIPRKDHNRFPVLKPKKINESVDNKLYKEIDDDEYSDRIKNSPDFEREDKDCIFLISNGIDPVESMGGRVIYFEAFNDIDSVTSEFMISKLEDNYYIAKQVIQNPNEPYWYAGQLFWLCDELEGLKLFLNDNQLLN